MHDLSFYKADELQGKIIEVCDVDFINTLFEHCNFIPNGTDKVVIQIKRGITLTDKNREHLRFCIKSVYGEDTQIVQMFELPDSRKEITPKADYRAWNILNSHKLWNIIQEAMDASYHPNIAKYAMKTWFSTLKICYSDDDKYLLQGSDCVIDNIYQRFQAALDKVVHKEKITIELHRESNSVPPRIFFKPNKKLNA